jgi:hypothetical protein
MMSLLDRGSQWTARALVVGFGAAGFWALLGVGLMGDAARRCAAWVAERDAALARAPQATRIENAETGQGARGVGAPPQESPP